MDNDQLEFLISQHFDGTLEANESSALMARIESDANASALFDEYAAVDQALRATKTKLIVDEDWLVEQIGDHLDEAASKPMKIHRSSFTAPLAMAACLLIGLTLRVIFLKDDDKPITAMGPDKVPVVEIALMGPAIPTNGVATISIGTPMNLTPQIVTALYMQQDDAGLTRVMLSAAGRRSADMFD